MGADRISAHHLCFRGFTSSCTFRVRLQSFYRLLLFARRAPGRSLTLALLLPLVFCLFQLIYPPLLPSGKQRVKFRRKRLRTANAQQPASPPRLLGESRPDGDEAWAESSL